MFDGKMKAVTFSFDDGVTQDVRLIELFDKYGVKATFNINSGLLGNKHTIFAFDKEVDHSENEAGDIKEIYKNHEVAAHTLTHPNLTELDRDEIIRQVEDDRKQLCELAGRDVVGMAYPCGGENNNDFVASVIAENTRIKYARGYKSSYSFDMQENLLRFLPTISHTEYEKMVSLAREFINMHPTKPQIFYIWGHSYELDAIPEGWRKFESFLRMISGRDDIFYGTNREVLLGK